ncbi:hypothetical protein AJ87_05395 [Rhizobium yanglingense]|nr:hypothetical protein AJ87_05395 [Rhizobium yanglingense]
MVLRVDPGRHRGLDALLAGGDVFGRWKLHATFRHARAETVGHAHQMRHLAGACHSLGLVDCRSACRRIDAKRRQAVFGTKLVDKRQPAAVSSSPSEGVEDILGAVVQLATPVRRTRPEMRSRLRLERSMDVMFTGGS